MPGTYEYRREVWQDLPGILLQQQLQQQSPNHLVPRTYNCCIIIYSSPIIDYVPGPLSSPVCEGSYDMYVSATKLINHAAFNVKSRPVNNWNSVSTAQLVELTSDVLASLLSLVARLRPNPRPTAIYDAERPLKFPRPPNFHLTTSSEQGARLQGNQRRRRVVHSRGAPRSCPNPGLLTQDDAVYMKEHGHDIDRRFGRSEMTHLRVWWQGKRKQETATVNKLRGWALRELAEA